MTSLDTWISENIPDVVMGDAAGWLTRLDSQTCNEADRLAFARWLAEDPTHRWAFQELSEIWARLRTLTEVGEQIGSDQVLPFPVDGGYRKEPRATRSETPAERGSDWSALAACLIVAAGTLLHLGNAPPVEKWSTGVSEMRQVELRDGSRVDLNARTDLVVRIDDKRRTIDLAHGEAVFDVAHDPRPFVVRTPQGTISALGTRFSVDSRAHVVEVAVIDGVVAVSAIPPMAALTEDEAGEGMAKSRNNARLAAGQGAELRSNAISAQQLRESEIERRLSWREGSARFSDEALATVLEDMRRYTHLSIHIGDAELGKRRISGRFSTRDIGDFLSQLSDNYNIFVDRGGQDWVVLRPASDRPEKIFEKQ